MARRVIGSCLIGAGIIAGVVAGCGTPRPLPITAFSDACRGVGLDAVLAGDPMDARIAWLETSDGREIPLVWSPGSVARFDPDLTVLDRDGTVMFRAGDRVIGGCLRGTADDIWSVMQVRSEDRAP